MDPIAQLDTLDTPQLERVDIPVDLTRPTPLVPVLGGPRATDLGEIVHKAGPYIGPKGGKWADPQHTRAWRAPSERRGPHAEFDAKVKAEVDKARPSWSWLKDMSKPQLEEMLATATTHANKASRGSDHHVQMAAQFQLIAEALGAKVRDTPAKLKVKSRYSDGSVSLKHPKWKAGAHGHAYYNINGPDPMGGKHSWSVVMYHAGKEHGYKGGFGSKDEAIAAAEAHAHATKDHPTPSYIGRGRFTGDAPSISDDIGKSTSSAIEELEDLVKAGGPFIGPKGGKWADPGHKVAWHDGGGARSPARQQMSDRAKRAHNKTGAMLHRLHESLSKKPSGNVSWGQAGDAQHVANALHEKRRQVDSEGWEVPYPHGRTRAASAEAGHELHRKHALESVQALQTKANELHAAHSADINHGGHASAIMGLHADVKEVHDMHFGEGEYAKSEGSALNELEMLESIIKAGGPYVGPHGGKWADPQHTKPWHDHAATKAAASGPRIEPKNDAYGFHGTKSNEHGPAAAGDMYHHAAARMVGMGYSKEHAVESLDSRLGRHMANEIAEQHHLKDDPAGSKLRAIKDGKHDKHLRLLAAEMHIVNNHREPKHRSLMKRAKRRIMHGETPRPMLKLSMGDELETLEDLVKGGPYIGPKGGKWADPQHTTAWTGEGSNLHATRKKWAAHLETHLGHLNNGRGDPSANRRQIREARAKLHGIDHTKMRDGKSIADHAKKVARKHGIASLDSTNSSADFREVGHDHMISMVKRAGGLKGAHAKRIKEKHINKPDERATGSSADFGEASVTGIKHALHEALSHKLHKEHDKETNRPGGPSGDWIDGGRRRSAVSDFERRTGIGQGINKPRSRGGSDTKKSEGEMNGIEELEKLAKGYKRTALDKASPTGGAKQPTGQPEGATLSQTTDTNPEKGSTQGTSLRDVAPQGKQPAAAKDGAKLTGRISKAEAFQRAQVLLAKGDISEAQFAHFQAFLRGDPGADITAWAARQG